MSAKKMSTKKKTTATRKPVKIKLYKNETKTAAKAPYLAKVIPEKTLTREELVTEVQKSLPHRSRAAINLIIDMANEIIAEKLSEGFKVALPFGTFEPHITGTFPCEDSPFDPARNKVVINVTPSRSLQKEVAKLEAEVVNGPTSDLALNGVETPSLGRAGVDVVKAGEAFMMTGRGFLDGALSAVLTDSAGAVHEVTLSQIKALYAQAAAPTGLALGVAQLLLTLTDDNDINFSVGRKVTVVA